MHSNCAHFKESAGLSWAAGDLVKPAGPPWRGWLGGAAFPSAAWSKCIPDTSAMLSRCGNQPAWRARLHKRVKDYRGTENKWTASGNTKDCMQRTAATTYHMAGKLRAVQGSSPPPSSSPLTNVARNLWKFSQIQERAISSATSPISSAWKTFSICALLKATFCIILYVRSKEKALRSGTNGKLNTCTLIFKELSKVLLLAPSLLSLLFFSRGLFAAAWSGGRAHALLCCSLTSSPFHTP